MEVRHYGIRLRGALSVKAVEQRGIDDLALSDPQSRGVPGTVIDHWQRRVDKLVCWVSALFYKTREESRRGFAEEIKATHC